MQGEVKNVRITEVLAPDERGSLARMLSVQFNVGDHGPFTMRFPAETTQPMQIRMKLDEFARSIDQITG